MSSVIDALGDVLEQTEATIRGLISSEASAGRYADIPTLVKCAEDLRDRRRDLLGLAAVDVLPASAPHREFSVVNGKQLPSEIGVGSISDSRLKQRKYPVFFREGGRLVKVGWSKSNKTEYEHKAGKAVLDAVIGALVETSAKKKTFSVEEISRLKLNEEGEPLPSYQVYVCIAWLRSEGLLERQARDEYAIPRRDSFLGDCEHSWERLPKTSISSR